MDVDPRRVVSTLLDPEAVREAMSVDRRRPGMVSVLVWTWLALALFIATPTAMVGLMMLATDGQLIRLPVPAAADAPAVGLGPILWLGEQIGTLIVVQLAVAFLIVVAAVGLYRLRAWARATLETLAWLGLATLLAWNGWFLYIWLTVTSNLPATSPEGIPGSLVRAFGVVSTLLGVVFYCAILGALLWMLRHKSVREAVAPVER